MAGMLRHAHTQTVQVIVPLHLPKVLDYLWAGEEPPEPGTFVQVEVGRKHYHGLVVGTENTTTSYKLKTATPLAHAPQLSSQTLEFYQWAARYNFAYPGEGLRAALIAGEVPPIPTPAQVLVRTPKPADEKLSPQRAAVLALFDAAPHWPDMATLARGAEVSSGVVKGLMEKGYITTQTLTAEVQPAPAATGDVALSPAQAEATARLCHGIDQARFQPYLLDGVTGSGKTEVYFACIDHMLKNHPGRQILVLVPEISLTPQWLVRFEQRLGFTPVVWHSAISAAARARGWHEVANGKAQVVIGARSALFLPFKNLGLVVVDEEHDPSYKQEDGFRYNGRDMAIVRAHLAGCPVVLASATPSLESWHHAHSGRYVHLVLPQRHGGAVLPRITAVDLKKHPPGGDRFLAPPLVEALAARLEKGEQSILFLNRRGFAPLLICRGCGFRLSCPSCSTTLVVHGSKLTCHHCGFTEQVPESCPQCGAEKLHPFGPGTRRVAAEVKAHFPHARIAIADRDNLTTPAAMGALFDGFEKGAYDILVGTQMVAKGHNFPNLTLVGVVDGDMGLAQGDLRAAERTFQLLTQVAGRAGRAQKAGEVLLQTHQPDHPLFAALYAYDRDAFYNLELAARRSGRYPPFGRLTALIVSGMAEPDVMHAARSLAQSLPAGADGMLWGPAPAPLARVRERFRYRLLLQTPKPPQSLLQSWLAATPLPGSVRVDVDVDPQSFY